MEVFDRILYFRIVLDQKYSQQSAYILGCCCHLVGWDVKKIDRQFIILPVSTGYFLV